MHGVPHRKEWEYPTAFSSWGDEEQEAIQRVVRSGRFTQGEEVAEFEREFATWHCMKYGIMVNSGSSANLIMIAALFATGRLKRGDAVIAPALAWSTTYAPLIQHGLALKLVDCDASWCFAGPYPDAKLAIGVSVLGVPAMNTNQLAELMRLRDGVFVEDNCEALGARHHGVLCGTKGLMNTFSFFYSHQISAIEGGMILTNDDECAQICRVLRAHGWTRDLGLQDVRFSEEYNFTHFGYNVRALELHAAVARVQLGKLKKFIIARQANLKLFHQLTVGLPIVPQVVKGLHTSPFGIAFCVAVPPEGTLVQAVERRSELVTALRAQGIDCRLPTGGSFTLHPYGRPWRGNSRTPAVDQIHHSGLFLGNAPFPIEESIRRAVQVIRNVLGEVA